MDKPLRAHTFNELSYYLMAMPCPSCGRGPRAVRGEAQPCRVPPARRVRSRCESCGHEEEIRFVAEHEPAGPMPEETINVTDEPSRIVDLARWLSLFYLLVERAAVEQTSSRTRRLGFQAALCLAEALKFYPPEGELPPESAFFSEDSREAFRRHPENFARQKLRDMQGKLPNLAAMAHRVARDEKRRRRRWWRFWNSGQ